MSGRLTAATYSVAASSSSVMASEPAAQPPRTPQGLRFQRRSAARVSSQPWTTASSSTFMYQWMGSPRLGHEPAPAPRPEAQGRNPPDRLAGDPGGHLRAAHPPLPEADGHLLHPQAGPQHAPGELDLEHVALGAGARVVDRLQRGGAEALEAPGEVAHVHAEHVAGVRTAGARQHAALEAPVLDPAARRVARAEHEV